MRAIILAAGAGERLEPITHTRPKPLIPILNKPLINYWIENLRACGIKDISVVINPSHKDFFSRLGVDLIFQTEGKGTGKALLSAKGIKDEILVIYSDVFLGDFSVLCKISNEGNSVLGVRVENPKEYGVLSVSSDGSLREIIEKPENPPSNLINSGVYKLDSDIFHYLEKISLSPRGELELTDAVTLMAKDKKIKVIEYNNYWIDIGRPWNIIDINKWALDNLVSSKNFGNIEDGVKIKGKVIIEDGVEIRSGTYIEGPVYIGKNSIIGPNSYLRPYTVLTENVKIGASVEVKESVIMEGSKILHLSYVGDSVIAEDVNFGAGTLIANLRFDEKEVKVNIKGQRVSSGRKKLGAFIGAHVRTGINVTILPGVKIGAYARIYPGAVVNRDVGYGEFFRA